jgi:hypothetical protein
MDDEELFTFFKIPKYSNSIKKIVPTNKRERSKFVEGLRCLHLWYYGETSDETIEMYHSVSDDTQLILDNAQVRRKKDGFCDIFILGSATSKDSFSLSVMAIRGIMCGILFKKLKFGVLFMNSRHVSDLINFELLLEILKLGHCWALNLGEVTLRNIPSENDDSSENDDLSENSDIFKSQIGDLLSVLKDASCIISFLWLHESSRDSNYQTIMKAVRDNRHNANYERRPWIYRGHAGLFWNRRAASVKKMAFNPSSMTLNRQYLAINNDPTPKDLRVVRMLNIT